MYTKSHAAKEIVIGYYSQPGGGVNKAHPARYYMNSAGKAHDKSGMRTTS